MGIKGREGSIHSLFMCPYIILQYTVPFNIISDNTNFSCSFLNPTPISCHLFCTY